MSTLRSIAGAALVLSTIGCSAADIAASDVGNGGGGTPTAPAGGGAALRGRRPFPADNAWNLDVSSSSVDANSSVLIAACGLRNLHPDFGTQYGIPYVLVGNGELKRPVSFDYASESDPGPYPIPADAPVEGGSASTGDRHVIVVDTAAWKLYELYDAHALNGGASWHAGSGAVFDLSSNQLRPLYWTSTDAAGLPVFPGLVRYDEAVEQGAIEHAIRFTCPRSQKGFIAPARHYASNDASTSLPPMGMRVRLRASFDIGGYPAEAQVILRAMKKYGMLLADNGSGWYFTGSPDARWNDDHLNTLKNVPSSAFDVIQMGTITR